MKRLRARILAMVALSLLAPVAGAASIEVTTFGESVDGDGLCSVREAVASSETASRLSARENNRITIKNFQDDIADPKNLERLQFPNQYYPRPTVQEILDLLRRELETHDPVDTALVAEVVALEADIDALPEDKVYLADVETTIDLIERTLEDNQAEIDRIEADAEADGCDDGSAFDTVLLQDGTYTLTDGEIVVTVNLTVSGTGPENSAITTSTGSRLFTVAEGASVDFKGLRLTGGDAGAGNGGAILAQGSSDVSNVVFDGNLAAHGGAVYIDALGAMTLEDVTFTSNIAAGNGGAIATIGGRLDLIGAVFGVSGGEGNVAAGNGGAVYVAAADEGSDLKIERASFVDNQAVAGAALYVGGDTTLVSIVNATFGENVASDRAAIELQPVGGSLKIKNVTITDNTAATGTAGLRILNLTNVLVDNTLIAGNTGGSGAGWGQDCDLSAVVVPVANFQHNFYAATADGCPGLQWSGATPENTNYTLPVGETVWTWLLNPLDAEKGLYVPRYPVDVLDVNENRLVNRGAGTQEAVACSTVDQRNFERASFIDSDCDIGAVEYQIGRRYDDVLTSKVNETLCVDITTNDIGDAFYTQYSLEILRIERAGTVALVASTDPAGYLAAWALRHPTATTLPTVIDLNDPALPQSCQDLAADPVIREVLYFTPLAGFQGETNVTYVFGWQTDAVPTPTTVSGTSSGIARMGTESAGGISSSSIGGATGPFALVWLALLALRRWRGATRALRVALGAALLLAMPAAQAVDNVIYVDSADDPVSDTGIPIEIPGDGRCTLREALSTARNDQANLTGGDCLDGNEGPDIIEFGKDALGAQITTITLNAPVVAWGGVTIRCPEDATGTCTIRRDAADPDLFALIDSRGSLTVQSLVFENGNAGTGNGGAINSAGGVAIEDCTFRNNRARTGGAVFLRGARGDLTIVDSTFDGNISTGVDTDGGGAVAMTAAAYHSVNVSGSTFINNQSVAAAAALSIKTTTEVVIVNSTFSGNSSSAGAGAIDVTGANIGATMRNLTVVDNLSGLDTFANPDVQRAAIEFSAGAVDTVLVNSIVSSNFDFATGLLDANCGAGTVISQFNMFGETFAGATCAIGLPGAGNQSALDTVVYDRNDLTTTDYLGALALNGFTTLTHGFNDPAMLDGLGVLVDAGSPAELVEPLERRDIACANVDQRGKNRASGSRCDIGAFEHVQVTAVEDYGSNGGRRDRLVIVDVASNDVADDLDPINKGCTAADVDPAPNVYRSEDTGGDPCVDVFLGTATGTVSVLRKNDLDDLHVILDIDAAEAITVEMVPSAYLDGEFPADFVPGWSGTNQEAAELAETFLVTEAMLVDGYVLVYDNGGVLANDDTASGVVSVNYALYTEGGAVSNQAPVEFSIENVPPHLVNDTVHLPAGQSVVVSVLANDEDYDRLPAAPFSGLDPSTLKITSASCEEGNDPGEYDCEFGRALIDYAAGTISWQPYNAFNPFTETISYSIKDSNGCVAVPSSNPGYAAYQECLEQRKESTANLTITIDRPVANGGAILGDDDLSDMLGIDFLGGTGPLFFLPLVLTLLRRRRRA